MTTDAKAAAAYLDRALSGLVCDPAARAPIVEQLAAGMVADGLLKSTTPRERGPEMIPLHQGAMTQWIVSVASECDDEDPWSGWINVHADARAKTVEVCEWELTPEEATNLAHALLQAAEHARHYFVYAASIVSDQQMSVPFDIGFDAPVEQSRAVHGWLGKALGRLYRERARADARSKVVPISTGEGE